MPWQLFLFQSQTGAIRSRHVCVRDVGYAFQSQTGAIRRLCEWTTSSVENRYSSRGFDSNIFTFLCQVAVDRRSRKITGGLTASMRACVQRHFSLEIVNMFLAENSHLSEIDSNFKGYIFLKSIFKASWSQDFYLSPSPPYLSIVHLAFEK